jgi:hypothetical protein
MPEALERAFLTLDRGASFLGAGLRMPAGAGQPTPPAVLPAGFPAKVIGNALRELDRFLNLLIDEAMRADGLQAFPGRRNTANKLQAYRTATCLPHADDARLRALGRSRDCLFHCGGRVSRGDGRGERFMTLGWPGSAAAGAPLRRAVVGSELAVGIDELAQVGVFYRGIAAGIVRPAIQLQEPRGCQTRNPFPEFDP